MNNWTVRQRIAVSFLAVLLLMGGMAAVAHFRLADIGEETRQVQTDSLPGLYFSAQAMADWHAGYSLTQQIVLQTERGPMERLTTRLTANRSALEQLQRKYEATIVAAKDRELFAAVRATQPPFARLQDEIL